MNNREKQVLGAIIDHYLTYGDTIGSRTLVKNYNIEFSSATIRNVMADLEDMGYIEKTHTSSGRVPTDLGYKFYLEELLKVEKLSKQEIDRINDAYEKRMNELESVLRKTSHLLSKLTSYAGVVIEPSLTMEKIKKVELVHVDDYMLLAVIISENLGVRTKKIKLETPKTSAEVMELSTEINNKLKEKGLKDTIEVEALIIKEASGDETYLVEEIERELYGNLEGNLFLDNTTSIFKDKNVGDVTETLELLSHSEEVKNIFEKVVKLKGHKDNSVNVIFGEELGIKGLEEFSFVYSTYKLGESTGVLGVIGPRRMAYSKTVGLVEHVKNEVNKVIASIDDKERSGVD